MIARASVAAPAMGDELTLAGRGAEIAVVEEALGDLAAGRGGVIALTGEPGIGKTRMLQEIDARAAARGLGVLRGRGVEFERDVPFATILDALDDQRDRLSASDASTPIERFRLHRAVKRLLEESAAERPVVLALDDLQWTDPASSELIAHLLRRWPNGPVLGVLAHRASRNPRPLERAIDLAAREGRVSRLALAPLTASEADEMLGSGLAPALRRRLHRESGGNPFYLRELAAAGSFAGVPSGARHLVENELAALSPSARVLMHGAAVAGEPFDPRVAAQIAGIDDPEAAALLDEALAYGLVHRARTGAPSAGTARFVFRHPIVARAVYELAGEGWRIGAHARAAKAFDDGGAPVVLLAHHVERSAAGGDETAVGLLEQAGHDAAPRAPAAAARWFAAALRLLPSDASATRRLALLAPLARALGGAGDATACRVALDEALALLPDADPPARAETVATVARVQQVIADGKDVCALLTPVLCVPCERAAQLGLCVEHWHALEFDAMAGRARAARRGTEDPHEALATALLAQADKERGATDTARRHARAAGEIVEALSDEELAGHVEALAYLGQVEHALGHYRLADRHLRRGLAIVRETRHELFLVHLIVALGFAQLSRGRLEDASASAETALDRLGGERPQALALSLACAVSLQRGDIPAALELGGRAVSASRCARSRLMESAASCWLGRAMIESGAHEQGRDRVLERCGGPELASIAAEQRPGVYAVLADAELALARHDAAERWVAAAERSARELGLAAGTADAGRARATLLLARDDPREAERVAMRAAAAYAELDQPLDAARADTLTARALALTHERERAVALLERAHATLDRCGAARYRGQAARELRRLGRRVARAGVRHGEEAHGVASLSEREREIAELVTLGHTNRRIAGELHLSERTVETHLAHVRAKLGVSRRAEVAARWTRDKPPHADLA